VKIAHQIVLLCGLALIPALVSGTRQVASRRSLRPNEVLLASVEAWSARVLWLDARSATKFSNEHVPGALPLTTAAWDQQLPVVLDTWKPGMKVVIYCDDAGCDASAQLARRLREDVGLPDVYFLKGGWEAWRQKAR
jgi:rhodanese-related sulfurtransferase